MRNSTRSLRARRRSHQRLVARRRLPVELLESRKVLSANGVPSNPLEGLSPELYLPADSRLYTYEKYDRDVFQNSDFAANIRELEQHRGNELDGYNYYPYWNAVEYQDRIPDLETAKIEYGPEASNYGDWYSDYTVLWPTTPSPVILPKTSIYSRDGMDPEGTYTPYYDPMGGNSETWGRMADDYDFTQWFFSSESIQDLFPQVKGWHANLSTFVPASPGNNAVVTSGTISFTDTSDPNVTVDYSIPWTLTVTQTLSGTEWTYEEQLELTGFSIVSTWDFDYTPYMYEIPDPQNGYGIEYGYGDPYGGGGLFDTALNSGGPPPTGQPGHVHRVLHQFGDYDFTFFAGGDDQVTETYSLTDEYNDFYTDSYDETFDPATLPFETEHHTYAYEVDVSRQQDDLLVVLVGDPDPYGGGTISDYDESGSLTYNAAFLGEIDSEHHLHVTGAESSHIDLDEVSSMTEELLNTYSVVYTGSGDLHENYYGEAYKVGTRQEDGTQTQDLETIHTGSFIYSDRLDQMTSNSYDAVTLRTENWDETLTYDSADTIDRDIQFLSNGNQLVTSTGSGSKTVEYWTEGNHTLNWFNHYDSGTGFVRDSTFHETRSDHSDPVHHIAAEIAPAPALTARVDTDYSENITRQVDSNGYVVSKTGTFDETGDAWLVRRLDFDGDWDVTGSGGDANWVIDTQEQQDYWSESLTDYYRFIFDDSTTFHANGTSTIIVDEEGEADGDWSVSEAGHYNWAAHSDSQDWTVAKTEFYGSSPGSVGGLTLQEWLQENPDEPWTSAVWAQGATRSDDWVYWYSDETTVNKSAGGAVTGRVGTVLTNIADPDSDADTIDGGTTRTPTQTIVHEANSQTGDRSEFTWTTYDYEYDPSSPTLVTYHNVQLTEWDEGYQITVANSQAVFDPSGSRSYTVDEEGFTTKDMDYDYEYENWWYSGGGHELVEGTSHSDRDSTWNYDDHYHTDVTALGEVLDSGTLHDWGSSTVTDEADWFYESYYSGSSGFDHWTYDGHGLATGSINYDYTTTISSEPDPYGGGGSMTTATVTGEQTDSQASDWNETVTHSWMYTYDYGNGPESYGDTETYSHGNNWSDSQTYTNEEFFGPRSGRERKYAWLLELFGFWD